MLCMLPFPCVHQFKSLINFVKRQIVSYEFIDFDLFCHIFSYQIWYAFYTLPTWGEKNCHTWTWKSVLALH